MKIIEALKQYKDNKTINIYSLIGESISKILGKEKLPKLLLIPSPHEERDRVRSLIDKRNLPSRIYKLSPGLKFHNI